jgi:hypothetical protein
VTADVQRLPDQPSRKRSTSSSNGSRTTAGSQQQQQQQFSNTLSAVQLQQQLQQQQQASSELHPQPQQQQQQQQTPLAIKQVQPPAGDQLQVAAAEHAQVLLAPEQQQQQQQQQPALFDPSELPIMDRVRLLRNRIAARQLRRNRSQMPSNTPGNGSSSSSSSEGAASGGRPPSLRYRNSFTSPRELEQQVLNACYAAGVSATASALLLQHVADRRCVGWKLCNCWAEQTVHSSNCVVASAAASHASGPAGVFMKRKPACLTD